MITKNIIFEGITAKIKELIKPHCLLHENPIERKKQMMKTKGNLGSQCLFSDTFSLKDLNCFFKPLP